MDTRKLEQQLADCIEAALAQYEFARPNTPAL
jgi:hypothetical protein